MICYWTGSLSNADQENLKIAFILPAFITEKVVRTPAQDVKTS